MARDLAEDHEFTLLDHCIRHGDALVGHGWCAGVEFEVDDQGDAVVLRPAKPFPPTTIDEVYGCLKYHGPLLTIEEMDEAVEREARRMWEGFERQW